MNRCRGAAVTFTRACGLVMAPKIFLLHEKSSGQISKLMESYIAGQLHCLPFILPDVCANRQ
jgi:hypothetical protein